MVRSKQMLTPPEVFSANHSRRSGLRTTVRRRSGGRGIMFAKPLSQRHITFHGVVGAVGRQSIAEDLPSDRIKLRIQVLHGHLCIEAEQQLTVHVFTLDRRHFSMLRTASNRSMTIIP